MARLSLAQATELVERALRLKAAGYRISTLTIPPRITPKNRLLLGSPDRASSWSAC